MLKETPFAALPSVRSATRLAIEEAALRANDRYLTEVVERHAFCPYSKEGRAAGETQRFVYYADSASLDPLLELMRRTCDSGVAVTQVILPLIELDAPAFIRFCAELTARGHRMLGESLLAVAPLHPELEFGECPHAMVPLFRRAPDPTIQWVRLDALRSLYAGRESDDHFVPPEDIASFLEAYPDGRPRLYDRICETNAMMARRLGVDRLAETLAEISTEARHRYHTLLLRDDA